MARANEAAFDELHALVAKVLAEQLQVSEPSPQMIAQAIKFLKDNGVDMPAKASRLSPLAASLADLEVDLGDAAAQRPN